ncbi:MAG: farnesyl diphosphate synthase [Pseudomonadota bacterium]
MHRIQEDVETTLREVLPTASVVPKRLHDAMRYSVLEGGKRIRPLLVYAAGEVTEGPPKRLRIAAAAVELIHCYSLVHDDLPCMDNDVLRRGKPTCHVEYDVPTAMLVGDSLQSLAFQLVSEYILAEDRETQLTMIKLLAQASGSRGMAGGQAIDLASTGKALSLPELELMHIHKTGALIRASVLLGVYCGQPLEEEELEHLDHYAKCTGLAFQVVDDILDTEADTATLGKTAGKDANNEKPTYVSIMGATAAKGFADELYEDAISALSGFDSRADRLRQLAAYIVKRQY